MLKQSSSRMKQILAILMSVLFAVSVTAVTASAADHGDRNGRHGGDTVVMATNSPINGVQIYIELR